MKPSRPPCTGDRVQIRVADRAGAVARSRDLTTTMADDLEAEAS